MVGDGKRGLRQGSVISPLLGTFMHYVFDLWGKLAESTGPQEKLLWSVLLTKCLGFRIARCERFSQEWRGTTAESSEWN